MTLAAATITVALTVRVSEAGKGVQMNIAKCVTLLACLLAVVAVSVPPSATADTSRTAVFRSGGQTLRIHATGRSGPFSTRIQLFVNGEVVAEGATTQFRPVVNLSGEYQGKQIDAE